MTGWSRHGIPILGGSGNVVAFSATGEITRKTVEEAMHYVYVLRSLKSGRLYIGSSGDRETRSDAHNSGRTCWSRNDRPWVRVLLDEHPDRASAEKRERYLKSGWGRRTLSKKIGAERCQSG